MAFLDISHCDRCGEDVTVTTSGTNEGYVQQCDACGVILFSHGTVTTAMPGTLEHAKRMRKVRSAIATYRATQAHEQKGWLEVSDTTECIVREYPDNADVVELVGQFAQEHPKASIADIAAEFALDWDAADEALREYGKRHPQGEEVQAERVYSGKCPTCADDVYWTYGSREHVCNTCGVIDGRNVFPF